MPRVHYVQKAMKDNPAVKAGQPYYWWKFMHQPRKYSDVQPRHSQLCQGKNSSFYAALEALEDSCSGADDMGGLEAARDECVSNLAEVADDYQEGYDNLPENFQFASTGETMQEAIDAVNELASELESWDAEEFEPEEFDEDEPLPNSFDSDEEYDDERGIWDEARSDHESQQMTAEVDHVDSKRDELVEVSGNHNFPY